MDQIPKVGQPITIKGNTYKVNKKIRHNQYSEVFRIARVQDNKDFALKCYQYFSRNQFVRQMQLTEVLTLQSVGGQNPNLVKLVETETHKITTSDQEVCLIVMQWCPGGSLRDLIDERRSKQMIGLREAEIVEIMDDISNAICELHSKQQPLAHRDLKLENVLQGLDTKWKVCGFGSCSNLHLVPDINSRHDIFDEIQKSTKYQNRAPEQLNLDQGKMINEKVDIWAMGCILYELMYFEHPFKNSSERDQVSGTFRIPSGSVNYGSKFQEILKAMFKVNPEERISGQELWSIFGSLKSSQISDINLNVDLQQSGQAQIPVNQKQQRNIRLGSDDLQLFAREEEEPRQEIFEFFNLDSFSKEEKRLEDQLTKMVKSDHTKTWFEQDFRDLGGYIIYSSDKERIMRKVISFFSLDEVNNLTHYSLKAISLLHKIQLYIPETKIISQEIKALTDKFSSNWRHIKNNKIQSGNDTYRCTSFSRLIIQAAQTLYFRTHLVDTYSKLLDTQFVLFKSKENKERVKDLKLCLNEGLFKDLAKLLQMESIVHKEILQMVSQPYLLDIQYTFLVLYMEDEHRIASLLAHFYFSIRVFFDTKFDSQWSIILTLNNLDQQLFEYFKSFADLVAFVKSKPQVFSKTEDRLPVFDSQILPNLKKKIEQNYQKLREQQETRGDLLMSFNFRIGGLTLPNTIKQEILSLKCDNPKFDFHINISEQKLQTLVLPSNPLASAEDAQFNKNPFNSNAQNMSTSYRPLLEPEEIKQQVEGQQMDYIKMQKEVGNRCASAAKMRNLPSKIQPHNHSVDQIDLQYNRQKVEALNQDLEKLKRKDIVEEEKGESKTFEYSPKVRGRPQPLKANHQVDREALNMFQKKQEDQDIIQIDSELESAVDDYAESDISKEVERDTKEVDMLLNGVSDNYSVQDKKDFLTRQRTSVVRQSISIKKKMEDHLNETIKLRKSKKISAQDAKKRDQEHLKMKKDLERFSRKEQYLLEKEQELVKQTQELQQEKAEIRRKASLQQKQMASKEKEIQKLQYQLEEEKKSKGIQSFASFKTQKQLILESIPLIKLEDILDMQEIGRGSSATVYKGLYNFTDVAIKKLTVDNDDRALREFEREAITMAQLKHENILMLKGVNLEGKKYFVTEYCHGGSLFSLLHEGKNRHINLSWKQKIKMMIDIAMGMYTMHVHKPPFIHRDLKSLNLLLQHQVNSEHDPVTVKVTDFGLSRTIEGSLQELNEGFEFNADKAMMMTGQAGTFHWMPPEIMLNQPYGLKADVYSFGICMWEIMARQPPFAGVPLPQILNEVVYHQKRPPIEKIANFADSNLIHLMMRCWDHEPINRPDFGSIITELKMIYKDLLMRK